MKRYLLFFAALLMLPLAGFSQSKTTSAIKGVVRDDQGEPLAGANVVAIHQPTGSRYGISTRSNGRFTLNNVQSGGPYTVQVTFVGFDAQKKEVANINLGETVNVNFVLQEGSRSLGETTVTARVNPVFNTERTGAKTNISTKEISETPQLSRSLNSYTSVTPHNTGGSSFGGTNNRYNNIQVDGATLNDVFGLSGNGIPGGQAGVQSPISIDAIKEINVDIAPFGVTNNNFNGAQINAITRSGTNQIKGSAYFQTRNERFEGKYQLTNGYGDKSDETTDFNEKFYGIRLGGPIIENKLFFFVNGELKRESAPVGGGLQGSGTANFFDLDPATIGQVQSVFQNQYGYDPGSYKNSPSLSNDNGKLLAKLNWNINDQNKFMLRYNFVNTSVEDGISRGRYSYDFANRQYNRDSKQNSVVAELNSNFGSNASNTFRAGYTRIRFGRNVQDQRFPQVDVNFYDVHGNGNSYDIFAGIDRFSQANSLDQDIYQLTDNFTYIVGNNEFTFGTSNHLYHFDNTFVQDQYGSYVFRGLQDFKDGNPYEYHLSYLKDGGKPSAQFSALQVSLYAQDKWQASDRFKLTFGLRADVPYFLKNPTYNENAEQAFGYDTSDLQGGQILWSPRVSFNWDLSQGNRATQLRGGVGIFSGPPPFVWISNQYSNTGADYVRISAQDGYINGNYVDIGGDDFFNPDPDNQPRNPFPANSGLSGAQRTEVDLLSDDFKYPQSLKMDLALDHELPGGITATLEGIYSKGINNVRFRNINLEQQATSKYGRPLYGEVYYNSSYGDASGTPAYKNDQDFNNVILLDNTNKGYRYSLTAELQKQFESGLSFDLSYTYNRARNINNGTSSRAISNWQYNENKDTNDPRLGTADFERRNHILARASYAFRYGRGSSTTISVIYNGFSGAPYSWIYNGNANGDTRFDNDLVYVPRQYADPSTPSGRDVLLASHNWNALNGFINDHPSLDKHRGEVVPRNTARQPFSNFLNLRVNQEVTTVRGQSIEFSASIFNVLNFLNYKWGRNEYVSNNSYAAWTITQYVDQDYLQNNYNGISNLSSDDLGKPVIDFEPANQYNSNKYSTSNISSRWRLQVGVRYNF